MNVIEGLLGPATLLVAVVMAVSIGGPPLVRWLRGQGRASRTKWFELVPRGERPRDVELVARGVGSWIDGLRNVRGGAVVHRVWSEGRLQTLVGIHGADEPERIVTLLAKAVGGEAVALEGPPGLPSGTVAVARRVSFDPLSGDPVEDPGAMASWVAGQFATEARACLSFTLEPTRPWEGKRLRAWLTQEETASAGAGASIGGKLGTATARTSNDSLCRTRVVAVAPTQSDATALASGWGRHLDNFTQGRRAGASVLSPSAGGALALAVMAVAAGWWVTGSVVAAMVVGTVGLAAAALGTFPRLVGPGTLEVRANLARGLVVAPEPLWWSPRYHVGGVLQSSFRDRDPTKKGRQGSDPAAHPHTAELFVATAHQIAGMVGFPGGQETSVATGGVADRMAPLAVTSQEGHRLGVDPSGRAVRVSDVDRQWGVFAAGDPSTGKALALDTPVPTPEGWTTMGALRVGDRVLDVQGRPCRVVFTTPVMHGRPCYRVRFSDGTDVVADDEHLWATRADGDDFPLLCRLRTTAEVAATVGAGHVVPPTPVLRLAHQELPEAPEAFGHRLGAEGVPSGPPGGDGVGVLVEQRIPAAYLRAGLHQRRELMVGLLAGAGTGGQWPVELAGRGLADDVAELLVSLGLGAVVEVTATGWRVGPDRTRGRVTTVVGVDRVEPVPVRCIQVDSPTRMYLVGRGMVPTHNTTLVLNMWWSELVARRHGLNGTGPLRGGQTTPIWIETKGDGSDKALAASGRAGYRPGEVGLIDMTGTSGPRLELVDRDDPGRSSQVLVEAMRYAFDADDIREASADVLGAAFYVALSCPPEASTRLGMGPKADVMRLAFWLLNGDPQGDRQAEALAVLEEAAGQAPTLEGGLGEAFTPQAPADTDLAKGLRYFRRYWQSVQPREREARFEPARNKLGQLLRAEGLWRPDPARSEVTFGQLLEGHWPVVLNFGPPRLGAGTGLPAGVVTRLAAMTLYVLWDAIEAHCDSWQAKGRSVAVFADELADLAGGGSGTDVVQAMVDQGRSRGVQLVLATQRLSQLPPRTAEAVSSFSTKVYFRLENYEVAKTAAMDLSREAEGGFTHRDVSELPVLTGACRTRVRGGAQSAFTLRVPYDSCLDWRNFTDPNPTGLWG